LTETERLEGLLARRKAHLHRYGTHTVNQIGRLLERVDARLTVRIEKILEGLTASEQKALLRGNYTTKRLVLLRANIQELASEVRKTTSIVLGDNGRQLAGYELEAAGRAYPMLADLGTSITITEAYAAATARPMLGRHIRDHIKDLNANYKKAIFSGIREGYVAGDGVATIVRTVRDTAQPVRNRAIETIVRTALNHISNISNQSWMEAAGVKRVKWVSTLDGRTSKICAIRDGKIYPIGQGERPPAHPNCRSGIRPYLDNEGGVRPFVSDKRTVGKIPKAERADKIGRVKSSTNFSKWFDSQPASFKKEWLGEKRYKLYKKGIKLDRFADPRTGREYNLNELKKMDAQAFKEAGL